MADEPVSLTTYDNPHLRIDGFRERTDYRPPRRAMSGRDSGLERFSHGSKLSGELAQALAAAHRMLQERSDEIAAGDPGVYIEIASRPETMLPDTAWQQKGIRIAAVRSDDAGGEVGGLFVPQKAEAFLLKTLADYTAGGGTQAAKTRLEQIDRFGPGTVATLWFDRRPPPDDGAPIWWECWCWKDREAHLIGPADKMGLRVSDQRLVFPESVVVPIYATTAQMAKLLVHTDAIEKLRNASDTPHVYLSEMRDEQIPLLEDLAERVTPAPLTAPAACVLDSGTNRGHPLLEPSLAEEDQHAVDANWGVDDHYAGGHGTQMAGMALLGDLTYAVGDQSKITLKHRLETVTLLPPDGFPPTKPANYGFVTQQAINLPEIEAPDRRRVFCMAVTNKGVPGDRPTSWSSAIDQAAVGKMDGEKDSPSAPKRLILISGGNIQDDAPLGEMTDPDAHPMEDPVQAWNAVGIGGFTDRDQVIEKYFTSHVPVSEVGDRSPYSRTSTTWPTEMPLKPEVVFEAGNRAASPQGSNILSGMPSLSLLTTNPNFIADPLTPFWATSAATGEAARFGTALQAAHPELWPETIRALMIHSARWTPRMLKHIAAAKKKKSAHIALARQFGYGVPSLQRAEASARADLALIAEAQIQPFVRPMKKGKRGQMICDGPAKFNDIHLYALPWPVEALEALGEKRVELKVTLSYFIEPSPSQMKPVTPARYRSHGLRFDLQRRTETVEEFKARINDFAAASDLDDDDADEGNIADTVEAEPEGDKGWMFGANSRSQKSPGSLHCDVWQGTAADLASRRTLAVFPVSGWWKYRLPQKRYNDKTRYALVMSLRCLDEEVDLYAEIDLLVAAKIAVSMSAV